VTGAAARYALYQPIAATVRICTITVIMLYPEQLFDAPTGTYADNSTRISHLLRLSYGRSRYAP